MADSFSNLQAEPWIYRPPFADDGIGAGGFWSSQDPFYETQALTRALQVSLSQGSSPDCSAVPSPSPASSFFSTSSSPFVKHETAFSDSDSAPTRRAPQPVSTAPTGRIAKRKSRASKRSPTTFITADPANFRQMVQQVTGVRIGDGALQQLEGVLMKPEPHRVMTSTSSRGRAAVPHGCLPTLDTSAFLLDRATQPSGGVASVGRGGGSFAGVESVAGGFSDFEIPCFPTLESWGVM